MWKNLQSEPRFLYCTTLKKATLEKKTCRQYCSYSYSSSSSVVATKHYWVKSGSLHAKSAVTA